MRPQRGARWAFGGSLAVRSWWEKEVRALRASGSLSPLYLDLKLLSQTARRARPWAMLARRATVQGVLASKSLSRSWIVEGWRWLAMT